MANLYEVKKRLMELISQSSPLLQPQEEHILANWHSYNWKLKDSPLVYVRLTYGFQQKLSYG
ncbi:MAG: hypothetical protein ACTSRP_23965, partial [Candidatus Helarchaeota archaeon]